MTVQPPIPMVDLAHQYQTLKQEIDASIADVLQKTHFIQGENVKAFEQEAAQYLGVKHAVGCANGTDALHLAMLALGIGPGDEVITTPFTFIATAEAIAYVGATPVFADIDPHTYNIDPEKVAALITDKTRAIVPVHLFGMPCHMQPIQQLADQHGLFIIEDCAQSFGARIEQAQTGGIGHVGCHSFFPSKNLGCYGDGGMLSTNDEQLAKKIKIYGSHGSAVRYHHSVIGYNSRLDELQAAILRQKLPQIDHFNAQRLRVAKRYCERLSALPIKLPPLQAPEGQAAVTPVFHQFTLLTEHREQIQTALSAEQVASAIYYPIPLHQQEALKPLLTQAAHCPIAEDYSTRCLSLPVYPELPDASVDRICDIIAHAIN